MECGWRSAISRLSSLLILSILSGCALFIPPELPPSLPPVEQPPAEEPEPEVVAEPEPEVVAEPEPEVQPEPEVTPPPQHIKPLVAVVLSNRTAEYAGVADALHEHLDRQETYDLSDRSLVADDAFAKISESDASAIVAIGLPAAMAARRFATVPVVVAQVFNLEDADLLSPDIKAVSVLPPIALQIAAWQALDPSIRNIGAILGTGHAALIAEADQAMKERGITFHHAIAGSDRETLYLFNRLVRDIDGFILFPDNRILSRAVLTEIMSYAARHRVQVAVYNEPLLAHGATFLAQPVAADVAAGVARVLEQIFAGDVDAVPPITGLSDIEVRTNAEILRRLGLATQTRETADVLAEAK